MKTILALTVLFSGFAAHASISQESTLSIIEKALACGKEKGHRFSVAVVNSEGNLMGFQRGDGAQPSSIKVSMEKAIAANGFRRATSTFVERINKGETHLLTLPGVVAIAGGVPIIQDGLVVGGLGISGASAAQDEECANIALAPKQ